MLLNKRRECFERLDGQIECYGDGFWYSSTGVIVKWVILLSLFTLFMAWFIGGYIHAKARMKKGKTLLGYHRFLISYQDRKRYGQTPQNRFAFYATQQPYQAHPQQRADGTWAEPPPMYTPPDKNGQAVEMAAAYQAPLPGQQQTGVVGGSGNGNVDLEGGQTQQQQLPPRPAPSAATKVKDLLSRFKK